MHNDGFRLTWRSLLFGVARSNEINGAQKESPGRGGQSGLKRAALKIYRVLPFGRSSSVLPSAEAAAGGPPTNAWLTSAAENPETGQ